MLTVRELTNYGEEYLKQHKIEEPSQNALMLLSLTLKRGSTFLKVFSDYMVSEKDRQNFLSVLEKKAKGEPIAHITGEQEFLGHIFIVDKNVLIPRPETEGLVEETLRLLKGKAPNRILDLCTGSGCIACSLSLLYRNAEVVGSDVSQKSLNTAIKNAENLNVAERIKFIKSNLFSKLEGKFDLIISNPPYIPTADISKLQKEVLQEPRKALDGGKDGILYIKKIINSAPEFLNSEGMIAMEIGYQQSEAVSKLFKKELWQEVVVKKDIFGVDRYIFSTLK
jgi:release factor glutamine methyltransferase